MNDPNDTLVIDLKRHNPAAFARLQGEACAVGLKPGWRSSHRAYLTTGGVGWHWNHNPPAPGAGIEPSPALPPPPGGTLARNTVSHYLKVGQYKSWEYVWLLLKELLAMPALELVRVYLNAYPQGCDTGAHQDSGHPDEVTIVLAVHEDWDLDYGGETAVIDARGEIVRAVLPVPGRAFAFRSNLQHAARPVARSCAIVRRMIVFKCAAWPVGVPIRSRRPDDLESTFSTATHEPFSGFATLSGRQRIAAAATWLSRTPAATWPHGRTNFASHLTNTALYLDALGADETTVLAGLAHAVFGTRHYRRRLLDPARDRALANDVFGPDAVDRALLFASIDRKALADWGRRLADGIALPPEGITLERWPGAPAPGGAIRLDAHELEALLVMEAANGLTLAPDPTESALSRPATIAAAAV